MTAHLISVTSFTLWAYFSPSSSLAVKGSQRLQRQRQLPAHRTLQCASARGTVCGLALHLGESRSQFEVAGGSPDMTYMDVLVRVLLRFVRSVPSSSDVTSTISPSYLQSEPKSKLSIAMGPFNEVIQSSAVDLLQALVTRGEIDWHTLQIAESVIVGKLYVCVHTGRLDLQNKMLHLLHSLISALSATFHRSTQGDLGSDSATYSLDPLLTQTLVDGISVRPNRAILQHWLDFILMTVPQFHDILQPTIIPLNDCVCRQLKSALDEITRASDVTSVSMDFSIYTTDADFIMLLNAMERLVLLSLSQAMDPNQVEDEMVPEKIGNDGGGLLGYVSNVFSTDSTSASVEDQSQVGAESYNRTPVNILTNTALDKKLGLPMLTGGYPSLVHHMGTACHTRPATLGLPRRISNYDIFACTIALSACTGTFVQSASSRSFGVYSGVLAWRRYGE